MKSLWKYIAGAFLVIVVISAFSFSRYGQIFVLEINRFKWEGQNVTHYRYHLTTVLLAHEKIAHTSIVEVKNGIIVSHTDENGRILPPPPDQPPCCTMEDIFDSVLVDQRTAIKISVKYDATYGFPAFIYTLHDVRIAGTENEALISISNFEILP